jgi:hypothetical protein
VNPTPSRQIGNPAKIQRRVFCAHYPACLDLAVVRQWEGFSCGACGNYQKDGTTCGAYWQQQAEHCGKLLKAIFIDKPKKGPGNYRSRPFIPAYDDLVEFWKEDHPGEPVPDRLMICPWLDEFLAGR